MAEGNKYARKSQKLGRGVRVTVTASEVTLTLGGSQNNWHLLEGRGTAHAELPQPQSAPWSWAQCGDDGCSGDEYALWTACPSSELWRSEDNRPGWIHGRWAQRGPSDLESLSAASDESCPVTGSQESSGHETGARPGWPGGLLRTGW